MNVSPLCDTQYKLCTGALMSCTGGLLGCGHTPVDRARRYAAYIVGVAFISNGTDMQLYFDLYF